VVKPIQGPVMPIPEVRSINRSAARDKRMQVESETDSAEESASTTTDEDADSFTKVAEVPASDIAKVSTAGMLNVCCE
jgi:hypothetical protein